MTQNPSTPPVPSDIVTRLRALLAEATPRIYPDCGACLGTGTVEAVSPWTLTPGPVACGACEARTAVARMHLNDALREAAGELLDAYEVLRAWGEARRADRTVRGYGSEATYEQRCATENAERTTCLAAATLADRFSGGSR